MTFTLLEIDTALENMDRFGGSFVKCLAELFRHADMVNQFKILHNFDNYFDEYRKIDKPLLKSKKYEKTKA